VRPDIGVDRSGSDGVHGDAGGAQLPGQGASEADHCGLGRGVGGLAEDTAALLRRDGRHVDDPAIARFDHVFAERLRDQVRAGGVDSEDPVPEFKGGFQEGDRGGDPRDVEDRPDGRQLGLDDRVTGLRHGGFVGDVDRAAEGRHTVGFGELRGELLGGRTVEVEPDHRPAVAGESVGAAASDPSCGANAGDDDSTQAVQVVRGLCGSEKVKGSGAMRSSHFLADVG
jgi:hypothetical protein